MDKQFQAILKMELPGMAADQLLIDESNIRDEHWEPPVRNLDRFFTSMYQYYVAKGLPAVILQQICSVVTLGFTIAASIFLIAFVDSPRSFLFINPIM